MRKKTYCGGPSIKYYCDAYWKGTDKYFDTMYIVWHYRGIDENLYGRYQRARR